MPCASSGALCSSPWFKRPAICALLICTVVISLFAGGLVTFLREVFVASRNLRIGHPQP